VPGNDNAWMVALDNGLQGRWKADNPQDAFAIGTTLGAGVGGMMAQ
jgi:hypothetical protein